MEPFNPNQIPTTPPSGTVTPSPSLEPPHRVRMWGVIIAVILAVLVAAGYVWWQMQHEGPVVINQTPPPSAPVATLPASNDTTAVIEADLNAVDVGDIEAGFRAVDAEIQSL